MNIARKTIGELMVTHYSQGLNSSSCGRTGASLATTQEREQVSCKTCLRSLGKPSAQAVATSLPSTAVKAADARPAKPARVATSAKQQVSKQTMKISASASWRNRLARIPGRNRLPRGARQTFI